MGRPPSDLDDYLDWQERLESYKASGLEVDVFCLQEGVSRSTFYRWVDRLKDGVPKSMVAEEAARERAEWIRQLYDIEDRTHNCSVDARRELRACEANPVLDKIEAYLTELAPRALPKSSLPQEVLDADSFVRSPPQQAVYASRGVE